MCEKCKNGFYYDVYDGARNIKLSHICTYYDVSRADFIHLTFSTIISILWTNLASFQAQKANERGLHKYREAVNRA